MDPIDSIKQLIHAGLPKKHLLAISILLACLLILLVPTKPSATSIDITNEKTATINLTSTLSQSDFEIPAQEAIAPEPIEDLTEAGTRHIAEVRSGDNLSLLFTRVGLTPQDVYKVSHSGPDADILTELFPGYTLAFDIAENNQLKQLEVITSPLESYLFTLNDQASFDSEHIIHSPEIRLNFKETSIQDSLFMAAQRGGISAPITMEIAGVFGGVIDFLLDTREGDTFNVLYEEKYFDNEFIGNGSILATQFTNQGETFTALRYINANGEVGYFNPEGESMRKAFLRNPVDFVRITSSFNPSRRHPILNTIRAHKGTDYAAPRGTPVVATSDGRVTWAARNGSFGNLVVIQHGERFETKYAHLSSYARGVRNGARVTQGQVIGYVGTTGGATGPHLHYEFLMDGVHRNSRTIHDRLPKAESIPEDEMQRFHFQTSPLLARLSAFRPTIAQNTANPEWE
ncbi:M23 family metallopeptidase [Gammaproteobacteria bacterium]|nr:M23 family metallopeptidase [Gammaproteobacteria bacterium]